MVDSDPKATLHRYLQRGREALLWKLDGLSEYDVRRPMTPTGTNLLGLVKHVASVELGYFGETFGREFPQPLPWHDEDADPNDDMWVTADQSRAEIEQLYRSAWAFSDETIAANDLDTVGAVPWWPEERRTVSLHQVLVHLIAETERHAGQADIIRETLDGAAGVRPDASNMPEHDERWWADYRAKLQAVADQFR
jgi:uncharacterized damage-inducible protein DinB